MAETESLGQSRRVEQMRSVETSPGVKVYRAGSIASRLVTEGAKGDAVATDMLAAVAHPDEHAGRPIAT